jgi:hypothetical protein
MARNKRLSQGGSSHPAGSILRWSQIALNGARSQATHLELGFNRESGQSGNRIFVWTLLPREVLQGSLVCARVTPMNRFIAFGDAILRATELARATRTKELRKWGKKSWQEVLNRPDQANFRKRLLQAYGKVRHLRIRRGWSSDCCAYQAIQEVTGART